MRPRSDMTAIAGFMTGYPELVVFATIAIGYLVGNIRIGDFTFGPVAGALFAGLLIGQIAEVPIAGMAKSYLFLLFLFGVGYSAGPQFLQAIRRSGVAPVLLAVVCTVTGLLTALALSLLLGLDPGFAGGLLAGGLTQSPAIGSASEAVSLLGLPQEDVDRLTSHVAVAYAVCYVFGSAGAIWFCSYMGPKLIGVDLAEQAKELGKSLGIDAAEPGLRSGYSRLQWRAYRIPEGAPAVGATIAEAEGRYADQRLAVLRVRRGERLLPPDLDLTIEAGDVLAVGGPRAAIVDVLAAGEHEVEDPDLLDFPLRAATVVASGPEVVGRTLADIAAAGWTRAVYLRSLKRAGNDLPVAPGITIERGDQLEIIGPQDIVALAAGRIGRELAPTKTTDFVVLGLMVFFGGLLGVLLRFTIFGVQVPIGTSVGVLLAGLLAGFLQSRRPFFGRIPDSAAALMTTFGLASFIAMVGLQSAPDLVPAIREVGLYLPIAGLLVALAPLFVGLYFGHYVLRMHPILLMGGLAGSQTATPAMASVQAKSGSPLPVLGYAPTYPVAQVLLTLWGSIIVLVVG